MTRMVRGALALLVLQACAGRIDGSDQPAATTEGPLERGLILTEISPLGPYFVEIANDGEEPRTLAGAALTGPSGERVELPEVTLAPGARWVLEGAPPALFGGGELALVEGAQALDAVSWDQVQLGWGGAPSNPAPGTVIARVPGKTLATAWTAYPPSKATPGAASPAPPVMVTVPPSGAIIEDAGAVALGTYPIPGAASYELEVSRTEDFASPAVRMSMGSADGAPSLETGAWFWRIRAIAEDGSAGDFSEPSRLHVGAPPSPPSASLAVPLEKQRKDTRLLLLESHFEKGAHAWDAAHPDLDKDDPADNMNCALASMKMINRFFGGNATQDRIGYEVRKDEVDGPEGDLNYGRGLFPAQTERGLSWALGTRGVYHELAGTTPAVYAMLLDRFWRDVVAEISAGRPVLAAIPGHAIVIRGYRTGPAGSFVEVNDPWRGRYSAAVPMRIAHYWTFPGGVRAANDEPGVDMDSDGDGVVDFDETARFHTFAGEPDSDGDDRNDKVEIRESVFDAEHGFIKRGAGVKKRSDVDGDKLAMELDEDSDGGGCFDGIEDEDHDGQRGGGEGDNFRADDDRCLKGTMKLTIDASNDTAFTRVRDTETISVINRGGKMIGKGIITVDRQNWGADQCGSTWRQSTFKRWKVDLDVNLSEQAVILRAMTPRPKCPNTVLDMCTAQPSGEFDCPLDGSQAAMLTAGLHHSRKEVPLAGGGAMGTAYLDLDFDASKMTP